MHLKLSATSTHGSSAPNAHKAPNTHSPSSPETMHALTLAHATRALEAHGFGTRRLGCVGAGDGDAFLTGNKPHSSQHAAVRARLDNSFETGVVRVIRGALLARRGWRAVAGVDTLIFVLLQCGDLASPQDGFKGQADKELGGGREEGAEGIGCRCENGVNTEGGAEEEGR
jgi:hypothetical protein